MLVYFLDRSFQRWTVPTDSEDYETEVVTVLQDAKTRYQNSFQLCIKLDEDHPNINPRFQEFSDRVVSVDVNSSLPNLMH